MMPAEQHYRSAIVALRNGHWENAAQHLLCLSAEKPDYRDVTKILQVLQEIRPVPFWCGTFEHAASNGDWADAQHALEKISELDPDNPNLSQLHQRIVERLPGHQLDTTEQPAPASNGQWHAPFNIPPAESAAQPTLDEIIMNSNEGHLNGNAPPETPPVPPESELLEVSAPPINQGWDGDLAGELGVTVQEVLPEAAAENPAISASLEPVSYLEDTVPHIAVSADTQPVKSSTPEILPLQPDPQQELSNAFDEMWVGSEQDGHTQPSEPVVYTASTRRLRWGIIIPIIVLIGVLIAAILLLQANNSLAGLIDSFGGIDRPSSPSASASSENLQILLAIADQYIAETSAPENAADALHDLHDSAVTLTANAKQLRDALLNWLRAGEAALRSAVLQNEACTNDSLACDSTRAAYVRLLQETSDRRAELCSLTSCPDTQP